MKTTGKRHKYYVYILTNKNRTVLYVGITNNLERRLVEHRTGNPNRMTFTERYNCVKLIWYERHDYVNDAIAREKQIKGWKRKKKECLINKKNPDWEFLTVPSD